MAGKKAAVPKLREFPEIRLDVDYLMKVYETNKKVFTYPSDVMKSGYICNLNSVVFLTPNKGFVAIQYKDLEQLIYELQNIKEDMFERRKTYHFENSHNGKKRRESLYETDL